MQKILKKLLGIVVLGLLWCNVGFAGALDIFKPKSYGKCFSGDFRLTSKGFPYVIFTKLQTMTDFIAITPNNLFLDYQISSKSFAVKIDRPGNLVFIQGLGRFNINFNNETGALRMFHPSTGKRYNTSCTKISKNELPKSRF